MKTLSKFNKIINMTFKDAARYLQNRGYRIRAAEIDGVPCICTRDYIITRVNVCLDNGIVIKIHSIG